MVSFTRPASLRHLNFSSRIFGNELLDIIRSEADCLQIFLKVESFLMAVTQLITESTKKNPEGLEKLPLYAYKEALRRQNLNNLFLWGSLRGGNEEL